MAEPRVQGWCPGALRPMQSGDGLLVRLRPRGGRILRDAAAGIARLAIAHGNGLLDLTSRANLQLRGVTDASYPLLMAGLQALDLLDATAAAEARRNIVVSPFWSRSDGSQAIAEALADALAGPDAPELPGKFGFAVDCGDVPVLNNISADIRLERGADGDLICRADGAAAGKRVTAESAVAAALALAHWYVGSGGVDRGRGRMALHVQGGATLHPSYLGAPAQSAAIASPKPGPLAEGFLVGLEFGQMRAETLAALALCGTLRATPWRMLLIENVSAAPKLAGLITSRNDPLLRVIACTGSPGCLQAAQPTRMLARTLAQYVPDGAVLHVAGCRKGCAHPAPATITLTAGLDGFDLIRNGSANDAPTRVRIAPEFLLAHPETLIETT